MKEGKYFSPKTKNLKLLKITLKSCNVFIYPRVFVL